MQVSAPTPLAATPVTQAAPAKINLFLRVTGRRADGYHLLDSLVVFAGARDTVRAEPSDALTLELGGRFGPFLAADPDNLVLRAARALAQAAGAAPRAALTLQKDLPVASGIGGGSADAAATLRALCTLWRVSPPADIMAGIALALGADVPVCMASRPSRMGGIGEILAPAPALPGFHLLLVNPGVAVATPAIFKARQGGFSPAADLPAAWPDAASLAADLRVLGNDLAPPAVGLCPVIGDVLAAIGTQPGCLLAQMSGSGATCFGLFPTAAQAQAAAAAMHPSWWVWAGAPWQAG